MYAPACNKTDSRRKNQSKRGQKVISTETLLHAEGRSESKGYDEHAVGSRQREIVHENLTYLT
jgi:hypothetical protein